MTHDPVHLFVGEYESEEAAEQDFGNVVALHRQGLVGAYDLALVVRGDDGEPRVERKKHSGHKILTGLGVGALLSVLTPFVVVPFGLIGAGGGALLRHAEGSMPKDQAEDLGASLRGSAAALIAVSNRTDVGRVEQLFPGATRRVAHVLDVEAQDFAEALRRSADEG
ncbi:MAG: hypothetical protein MUF57_08605 [Gammaproteobacteria bacterium]|jgi:uncharacterized membrane protein|nr:hypothetical protein [Gammaproteobacteria bacterium]